MSTIQVGMKITLQSSINHHFFVCQSAKPEEKDARAFRLVMREQNIVSYCTPASFIVRNGMAGGGSFSFESVESPGFFLRHQNYEVKVELPETGQGWPTYSLDASFTVEEGLGGEGFRFRAILDPSFYLRHKQGFYIRHHLGELVVDDGSGINPRIPKNASDFNEAVTFIVQSSPAPTPSVDAPFTEENIKMLGIDQGGYGDCVFEASAAALASTARGRRLIAGAISCYGNGKGLYLVTFPAIPDYPFVANPGGDWGRGTLKDSYSWAEIFEAAYLQTGWNFGSIESLPENASECAANPTPAQYALWLMTGVQASNARASDTNIGTTIHNALDSDQAVVAYCFNDDNGALVSGHEWTVVECSLEKKTVTLRNPWGHFHKKGENLKGVTYDGAGEVTLSLNDFPKYFEEVSFGLSPADGGGVDP